tara:strand:- start:10420 stop:10860 length:441 start_codon:yes stop_codon:yes gene_type:complete
MQTTVRKTNKMLMMEYKFDNAIEDILINALVESRGEQKEASSTLDISEASFSRWIQQLGLDKKVSTIRKKNGLPPTPRDLHIETESGKELIEIAVVSRCSECDKKYEDLISHKVTGITSKNNQVIAVVRDELNRKHWFSLNMSKIE